MNFFNPIPVAGVCVAAKRCFPPSPPPRRLPRGTVSTTVTIGRSFKMQTRGPWGFKTPAIPGFRSAANLARASYGFTPPLTRFYSRAGRQTFSAPIPPLSAKFSYAVYSRI